MSKIGKINISIPDKVKVVLSGNNLNIEGPLGKQFLPNDIENDEYGLAENVFDVVSKNP